MRSRVLMAALLLATIAPRAWADVPPPPLQVDDITIPAPGVSDKPISVHVLLPRGYADARARYPVLYFNDGQDREAVGVANTLAGLMAMHAIVPIITVAIDMPPDRMGAYGASDRAAGQALVAHTKYGDVGTKAQVYSEWVVHTLVPAIDARYRTRADARDRAILGWSLGALNAFSVGWQYPEVFGTVGAFSPSFWLSGAPQGADAPAVEHGRLVHRLVDRSPRIARGAMFFAAGTEEETSDRDHDGVIDVIDDTEDLLQGWRDFDGRPRKGLRQFGYAPDLRANAHPSHARAAFFPLAGGHHRQDSWARMLPVFLRWAYAPSVGRGVQHQRTRHVHP